MWRSINLWDFNNIKLRMMEVDFLWFLEIETLGVIKRKNVFEFLKW